MDDKSVYEWLEIVKPETLGNPEYVVSGSFKPAHIPELMEHIISSNRERTKDPEPYTYFEYKRLHTNESLIDPPNINDDDLYRHDSILSEIEKSNPLYDLRRAFIYRQACQNFKNKRDNEKELLRESRQKIGNSQPSYSHYLVYIAKRYKESLGAFFRPWRLPILEEDRKRHTIITGKSGYGKSTLLKVLIYNYLKQGGKNGVILVDPHGDIAEEIAKLNEHLKSDRLVYFDPRLHPEYSPVINPFDIKNKSPESIEIATNELLAVFESVFESSNTHFTPQMQQILKPCISTLMIRPDSSIVDLMDFMDDEKNPPLISYAKKVLKNPVQVNFFETDFLKDSYAPSKQAIRTKLLILLNSHTFYKCLVGQNTIDLEYEMDRGAVIVFNLSSGKISAETSEAIGRFYIGLIQSIAQQRADIAEHKRQPVHLFIDECGLFISKKIEKILTESRKYKLYLTLAQQVLGQKMSEELKDIVISNTGVKMTGANGSKTLKKINTETGADIDELQNLKIGEFHLKSGQRKSIILQVPDFLKEQKYIMSANEWEQTKSEQIQRYYRRNDTPQAKKTSTREAPIIDLD